MNKRNIIIIGAVAAIVVIIMTTAGVSRVLTRNRSSASGSVNNGESSSDLLKSAQDQEEKSDLISARQTYQRFINEFPGDSKIQEVTTKLEDLNIKLIFSPVVGEDSFIYEVKPSDTLSKIAKDNNTTVALIKKSNNLSSDTIRPGMRLKIVKSRFSVFVDKSQNVLILKKNDEIMKNYAVSTGKNNSTPVGKFKIINKIENPVWFKAGVAVPPESAENILGSRWLGFDLEGYGIHGTTEPQTIGQQVTQGCVRMRNRDVEELFDILPVGTEVSIVD